MPSRSNGSGRFPASRASSARSTTSHLASCGQRIGLKRCAMRSARPVSGFRSPRAFRSTKTSSSANRSVIDGSIATAESVRHLGECGVGVVCYNFMPLFDWMRTDLEMRLEDGSTTVAYDHRVVEGMDLSHGLPKLTAWVTGYDGPTLARLLSIYRAMDAESALGTSRLFSGTRRAGGRVVERQARVASGRSALGHVRRAPHHQLMDRRSSGWLASSTVPANGITFCTGSFGALASNDLPAMIRSVGRRIHFAHCRNVRITGDRQFYEAAHPTRFGDVPMRDVMVALSDVGFTGPMRPDHGRMIWGETGRTASGLYDRALGAGVPAGPVGRRAIGSMHGETGRRRRPRRDSPLRLPLDDPRPAVFGDHDQLPRSPGARNSRADARTRARLERAGLRAHRLVVQLRVRLRAAADRPHLRLGRHAPRLLALGRRLEPGLHGPCGRQHRRRFQHRAARARSRRGGQFPGRGQDRRRVVSRRRNARSRPASSTPARTSASCSRQSSCRGSR